MKTQLLNGKGISVENQKCNNPNCTCENCNCGDNCTCKSCN